jgi:hypothetical protein
MDSETGQPVARLIGYNLPQPYAVAGTYFPIELCWEPLGVTDIPYAVFVQMLDIGQLNAQDMPTVWGRRETFPGLGNRPTDRWTLHKVFCDMTLVPVFAEAPTPLGAAIEVGLTDQNHRSRLQALDAAGDSLDLAAIGGVPILSSKDLTTAKRTPLYTLDNAIGLDQILVSAGAGNSLTLTMTWQSLRSVVYDATMFVHTQDAEGNIVAQADRQPLEGRFPTSYWQPGQIITDVVRLSLEADKLDQPLTLNVGLYIWPSMLRLPVKDAYGAPQRDDVMVVRLPPGAMQVGVP